MIRISLIYFLLFSFGCAKSQQIIYDLPQSVTKKLVDHISKNKIEDGSQYVIKLSAINDGKWLLSIFDQKSDTTDIVYKTLITNTSRFIRVEDHLLPMITSEDLAFADFGTIINPNVTGKRRVGKRKVMMTLDTYTITFDGSGRIY